MPVVSVTERSEILGQGHSSIFPEDAEAFIFKLPLQQGSIRVNGARELTRPDISVS